MEAVASSCLGTQVAREGSYRLGKHLSQGKGPGTGDLAIAALDPTQVESQVIGCPEFGTEAPGPCGGLPFPRNEASAQPADSFHEAEGALGRASNQRGPRLPRI